MPLSNRIYGELCATYESASTRRFRLGRVDCVRASHKEALDWVKFMMKQGLLDIQTEQMKLFKIAMEKQTKASVISLIFYLILYLNTTRRNIIFETPIHLFIFQ